MLKLMGRGAEKAPRPELHTLGGKTYQSVTESTVQQDHHYMRLIRSAGIDVTKAESESYDEYGQRVLAELTDSGAALPVLGCLMVPEGTPATAWTPEMAEETAKRLGQLTGPEDKAHLNNLILSVLISFFESGLASSSPSATFSRNLRRMEESRPSLGTESVMASGVA